MDITAVDTRTRLTNLVLVHEVEVLSMMYVTNLLADLLITVCVPLVPKSTFHSLLCVV